MTYKGFDPKRLDKRLTEIVLASDHWSKNYHKFITDDLNIDMEVEGADESEEESTEDPMVSDGDAKLTDAEEPKVVVKKPESKKRSR